ncbi:hypothetical protein FO446_08355 [Brevibacillus brevis]|nr:hypothetical protein [Brevibacillus sp. AF8]UKK97426.1 hypothetical protein FO446_08355 [Brevibacillus brevis]
MTHNNKAAHPISIVAHMEKSMAVCESWYGSMKVYRAMFEKYLEERGLAFSQMMELWSIEAIKRCVRSGLGITCLPLMTVKEEIEQRKVKIIPCDSSFPTIFAQVVYHKNKWVSPAMTEFIAITLQHEKSWA